MLAASDDAARLRDALGVALPVGLPAVYTEAVDDPLGDLALRYARAHGPFLARDLARWLDIGDDRALVVLARLVEEGRLLRGEFRPGGFEREFCDDDVLRQLRRRSLAVLRREVEPVDPDALARFLPGWQGVGGGRRGVDGLAEVIGQLQGSPIAASVLESDVLAVRVRGFRPSDLDQLCTTGEVVWVGAGSVGARNGRIRLLFREQASLLLTDEAETLDDPIHAALRAHLADRGASFWPDLVVAAQAAELPYDQETVLAALWDLVWAGQVTNDSLAPVRALVAGRAPRRARSARAARGVGRRRPRPGQLPRLGPPTAAGRWSLVAPLREPVPSSTEAAHARAQQLLDRYGVLTREAALGEGLSGGFAGVYPVLKALEERGEVRRGYFVAGLGAAQFALPERSTGSARPARPTRPLRRSCWLPPTRRSPMARRWRGPTRRVGRRGPPAPTSCWSTGPRWSRWSGAVGRWSRSGRPSTATCGSNRSWSWSRTGGSASSRSARSTAYRSERRRSRPDSRRPVSPRATRACFSRA